MLRRISFLVFVALAGALLPAPPIGAAEEPTPAYEQVVDITFPTDSRATYTNSYDSPRSGGRYHRATDLMGQKLWKVYAAVGGTITWIPGAAGEPMPSYGYMIKITGTDGRTYNYVHLNNDSPDTDDGKGGVKWAYAPGLEKGSKVVRGQFIGYLGDSGNAENTGAHLHFEIQDPDVTDPYGSDYIDPYFSLKAAEAREDYSSDSGTHTATTRSTDLACPAGTVPEDGLTVLADGAPHEASVDCAVWWAVVRFDDETAYVPGAAVDRGQMATFAARLMEASGHALVSNPADRFADDGGSPDEVAINQLAAEGLVNGVAEGTFGPDLAVSRAQMATFLVGVVQHITGTNLEPGDDHFTDDDGNPHEPNIERLANAGLAAGTAPGTYSPHGHVRHDQMASFLVRTLDLLVESGFGSPPA